MAAAAASSAELGELPGERGPGGVRAAGRGGSADGRRGDYRYGAVESFIGIEPENFRNAHSCLTKVTTNNPMPVKSVKANPGREADNPAASVPALSVRPKEESKLFSIGVCNPSDKITSCLKSLRLRDCIKISEKGLVAVGKTSPCLEELELTTCTISILLKAVGEAFPNLKCLRLNHRWFDVQFDEFRDNFHALGIACSMHRLRHLQIFANRLRNNALAAILDNCPHLESLDLRQCFNVDVDAEVRAKCARLKDVRFPNDSTKDYEYETFIETPSLDSLPLPFPAAVPQWPFHGNDEDDDNDGDQDDDDDGDQDDDDLGGHRVTEYGFIIGDYHVRGRIIHHE
ncbi:hypothetical protein OsJ_06452 [Oryza sativa Japonica Group]|uniref:Uncharacterized protein n=1 Tax=Oryza sativa subsp. japonica TaxID=39947 RepID=B9F5B1_ORYSJ|nr:hypothetical protein OsJ_06452 [Oryza sativa Japonica Group]